MVSSFPQINNAELKVELQKYFSSSTNTLYYFTKIKFKPQNWSVFERSLLRFFYLINKIFSNNTWNLINNSICWKEYVSELLVNNKLNMGVWIYFCVLYLAPCWPSLWKYKYHDVFIFIALQFILKSHSMVLLALFCLGILWLFLYSERCNRNFNRDCLKSIFDIKCIQTICF